MVEMLFFPVTVGRVKIIDHPPRSLRRTVCGKAGQDAGVRILSAVQEGETACVPVVQFVPDAVLAEDLEDILVILYGIIFPTVHRCPSYVLMLRSSSITA